MTTGRELEVNLSALLGLNNRRPDFRLRTKDGVFVRAAVNSLVSDAGSIKRRSGYAEEFAGADCHSFWVDTTTDTGYYADTSTLYRVRASGAGLAREVMVSDLARGRMLTYARVGTDVVFSDGVKNRCIGAEGERPFGVPSVQTTPVVTPSTGGSLTAGAYQVCFAYANDQLEIGGTTPAALVDVPANGKLTITNLPAAWPLGADTLLIYVSTPNGTAMFVERRQLTPSTTDTISVLLGSGMQASTYLQRELPPGRILRFYGTRLYVADGVTLWYSDIYSPALCSPSRSFVMFQAPITVVEPCDDGLFVVADATYWLGGDIESATLKEVSPATGVFGTGRAMPHQKQCFWMSNKGIVMGSPGGAVELLQDENVVVPGAAAGASLVLETDGQRHAISSLFGAEGATAAARSYMDTEVVRKGTTQ